MSRREPLCRVGFVGCPSRTVVGYTLHGADDAANPGCGRDAGQGFPSGLILRSLYEVYYGL